MRGGLYVLLICAGCTAGVVDGGDVGKTNGHYDAGVDHAVQGSSTDMTGPVCVPAAKENCANDIDDDCDGTVNNGCADSLGIGTTRIVAPYVGAGDNAGAQDLTVRCPANAFVTTLTIAFADTQQQVAGLRIGCSTATLTSGSAGYAVTLVGVSPSPFAALIYGPPADSTGDPIVVSCTGPGLRGLFAEKSSYDAGGILGFLAKCGTGTLALQTDNTLQITMAPATGTVTPAGSTDSDGYGGFDYATAASPPLTHTDATWTCNSNEVVIGFNGRVSTSGTLPDGTTPAAALDMVQPVCGTLTPHYIQ